MNGSIGDYAFSGCLVLTSAYFPAITTGNIGEYAFSGCNSLTSVEFPTMTTGNIGKYAFSGCDALNTIDFQKMNGSIGDYAFSGCLVLTSVDFPTITTGNIGEYTFSGCDALTSVEFPAMTTGNIGKYAFSECGALNTINFQKMNGTIGEAAFSGCDNIAFLNISSNTESISYQIVDLTNTTLSYGGSNIDFEGIEEGYNFQHIIAPNQSPPFGINFSGTYIFSNTYSENITGTIFLPEEQHMNIDWCKLNSVDNIHTQLTEQGLLSTDDAFKGYVKSFMDYKNYISSKLPSGENIDWENLEYVIGDDDATSYTITDKYKTMQLYFNNPDVVLTIDGVDYNNNNVDVTKSKNIEDTNTLLWYPVHTGEHLLVLYRGITEKTESENDITENTESENDITVYIVLSCIGVLVIVACIIIYLTWFR